MNKNIIKIVSGLLLCSFVVYTTPIYAFTKEESVYAKINASGDNYKTIVSTHLKNEDQEAVLKDLSDLINIENTNGDEEFSQNGEELIWNANGSDIYYQGETKKELPIKCSIKYELDSKEILPEDLLGKSGKVKITISYENLDEHKVLINGKTVSMYTPFTVITGTIFDNTENKNIEVSSGKVVNDGTKTIVMGVSMPGMQESLNLSKSKIDIPSSIEITMDTEKYEQKNIITFVTPKIFEEKISFNELNDLYNKIDQIQEASSKIEDGANTLKEGMRTLNEGSNTLNNKYTEFDSGITKTYEGSKELLDGTTKVNSGVSSLQDGTSKLNGGMVQINNSLNNVDLSGLGKLASGITSADDGVGDLKDGVEELKTGANSFQSNLSQYVDGTEQLANGVISLNNTITTMIANYTNLLNNEMAKGADADQSLIIQYSATIGTLQNLQSNQSYQSLQLGANSLSYEDPQANNLTSGGKLKAGYNQINQGISGLSNGIDDLAEGTAILSEATGDISDLGSKMTELKTNLTYIQSKTEILDEKMLELKDGTEKLNKGTQDLSDGLSLLDENSKNVKVALIQLAQGSTKLEEGSIQLSNGITEFNSEAIDKIVSYVNSDVRDVIKRAEKLQELSQEYNNFTKASDNSAKEVKFILITDSIKEKKDND